MAEGGANDEGDVEVNIHGTRWVIEAKARQQLSVQEALGKARQKAKGAPTALIWKRLTLKTGQRVRTPVAGEPVVVVLSLDDFLTLVKDSHISGFILGATGEGDLAPTVPAQYQPTTTNQKENTV